MCLCAVFEWAFAQQEVSSYADDLVYYRNIPVRWHAGRDGPQMIVHDAVMVSAPFEPANCVAPADKQAVLQLVKRVIEGERKKLGLSAASGGVRKGG